MADRVFRDRFGATALQDNDDSGHAGETPVGGDAGHYLLSRPTNDTGTAGQHDSPWDSRRAFCHGVFHDSTDATQGLDAPGCGLSGTRRNVVKTDQVDVFAGTMLRYF